MLKPSCYQPHTHALHPLSYFGSILHQQGPSMTGMWDYCGSGGGQTSSFPSQSTVQDAILLQWEEIQLIHNWIYWWKVVYCPDGDCESQPGKRLYALDYWFLWNSDTVFLFSLIQHEFFEWLLSVCLCSRPIEAKDMSQLTIQKAEWSKC